MYPYKVGMGQRISTNGGRPVDRAFIAHVHIPADDVPAADDDGIIIAPLAAEAAETTQGFANPAWPRALTLKANKSGITSQVTVYGKNVAGDDISEAFTLAGTTKKNGAKAFASIEKIELPAQTNVPAKQTETLTVSAGAQSAGTVTVTLTAAEVTGSPVAVEVELAADDTTAKKVAEKIVAALNASESIAAKFAASNAEGVVTLTAKEYAANDATLAFAFADTDTTSAAASGADGTAGIVQDQVLVGWGDILGLPCKLAHDTMIAAYVDNVKEASAWTLTKSETLIENNTIKLHTPMSGKVVDLYYIV